MTEFGPGERRPTDEPLAQTIREAVRAKRREALIPIELRLSQDVWNRLSPSMRFEPFGGRRVMLFEGLPCVLIVGSSSAAGFTIKTIEPRSS